MAHPKQVGHFVKYRMNDTLSTTPLNIPIPDPSQLTTESIRREIAALRDATDLRLDGEIKLTSEKFEQSRRERELIVNSYKTQLADLSIVLTNRLEGIAQGIQKQFEERDVRSKAAELAAQVAVGAALQAQKEAAGAQNESNSAAITKSESATVKQIDGILALLSSNSNALNDKIAVINGRLDRNEGHSGGISGTVTMGLAICAVVVSLFTAVSSYGSNHSTIVSPAVVPIQGK